jgi:hypothetical protein
MRENIAIFKSSEREMEMTKYQIENTKTGVFLGVYEGADEAAALDAMAQDAGYVDYADVTAQMPVEEGEIAVYPVEG